MYPLRFVDAIGAAVLAPLGVSILIAVFSVLRFRRRVVWPTAPAMFMPASHVALAAAIVLGLAAALLGAPDYIVALVVTLSVAIFLPPLIVRFAVVTSPRLHAVQQLMWLLLLVLYAAVVSPIFGVEISESRLGDFYSTIAQLDVALLIVAAFQSRWARGNSAVEGVLLITVGALAMSLLSSLVALGAGTDSGFAFSVTGLVAGLIFVCIRAALLVEPKLLERVAPPRGDQGVWTGRAARVRYDRVRRGPLD